VRQGGRGAVWRGTFRSGGARSGGRGSGRFGRVGCGQSRRSRRVRLRPVWVRLGPVWRSRRGELG